jgi:hypothetical protein
MSPAVRCTLHDVQTSRAISNMSTEDNMIDKFGSLGACEALLDAARAHSRPESHEAIEQVRWQTSRCGAEKWFILPGFFTIVFRPFLFEIKICDTKNRFKLFFD